MVDRTRVYLTGADGMLGTALMEAFGDDPATGDWLVHGVSLADFDIADGDAVRKSMAEFAPQVVIHAAAHAVVDECEADPRLAMRVNTRGVRNVVDGARRHGSRLVYLSSDYVFDGQQPPPGGYREGDLPSPVSVYGLTKLAGERISQQIEQRLIVRTSWLFGGSDERVDVVLATLRRAAAGQRTRLIADQLSTPTYTADLARAIVALLHQQPDLTGTIHVANGGAASWYEVGSYALREVYGEPDRALLPEPLTMSDSGFLGERPRNSALSTLRLSRLGIEMPHWREGVRRFCDRLAADQLRAAPALAVGGA